MNTKRTLPLIVLAVVSLFVFACAIGVVWILSVDAHTTQEKLQVSLTLGIPSALALIVLLWFGAGMDHVLARLKQRSTRISVSLLTYIVVPVVLCVGLPALAAAIIYGAFNAPKGWQLLPAPPEPAVQIAGAGELSVVVRTDAQAHYVCGISSPSTCWDSTSAPEQRMTGRGTEISTPPSSEPPQGVISMLGLSYMDMGVEGQVHYAVLEDGSVWYLQKDENKYEAGFASGLFLTIAIIPAIAGLLVIYLGAGMSAVARWLASQNTTV
jgi:hypothetical protein